MILVVHSVHKSVYMVQEKSIQIVFRVQAVVKDQIDQHFADTKADTLFSLVVPHINGFERHYLSIAFGLRIVGLN